MEDFQSYLETIKDEQQRMYTKTVLNWVSNQFPQLETKIAWNQPMFTDHGTYIIGFSVSSKHLAISPELAGMKHFSKMIKDAGYEQSKMLFKIKWDEPVNYPLLEEIITFNCTDKADCLTFWR